MLRCPQVKLQRQRWHVLFGSCPKNYFYKLISEECNCIIIIINTTTTQYLIHICQKVIHEKVTTIMITVIYPLVGWFSVKLW